MGQSELGAALLHHLEEFPVFALDIPSLHADPSAKVFLEIDFQLRCSFY